MSVFNLTLIVVWLFLSLMHNYLIMAAKLTLLYSDFYNFLGFDVLTGERILSSLVTFIF